MLRALILLGHGARDPNWATPFIRLQQNVQRQLPECIVKLAFLEFMTPNLLDLIDQLVQDGCHAMTIVPVFLGKNGHVVRDVPPMLQQVRIKYPDLILSVVDAVGEDDAVLNEIAQYCISSLR